MEQSIEPIVVGVRFSKVGKVYHFAADTVGDVKVGDMVVVETSRGWQLGQVAQIVKDPVAPPEGWKMIDRRATPRDLLMRQMWQMKEAEVITACKDRAATLNLVGIKIVSAEYSFDGARLTIEFSSETEEKFELKSLRQDMQRAFSPSQVEMRQVGPRDVAKTMCGMGACGLETRCCCLFLTEFSSISIRMAKDQGISLTPTEITGMCGRLRCCLIYEYDTYVDARSKLPKRNKRVRTPQGDGKVVDVIPLRESVVVDLPEVGRREFSNSEIILLDADGQPINPPPEMQQPAAQAQPVEEQPQSPDPDVMKAVATEPSAEGRAKGDQPRSSRRQRMPDRSEQGQRSDRRGREMPGGRDRSQRRDAPRDGQPAPEGKAEQTGEQSSKTQQQPDPRQQGGRGQRNRPQQRRGGPRSEQQQPQSGQPAPSGGQQPKQRSGGSGDTPHRTGRDSRRRKGQRRDSNDTENRS